MMNRAVQKLPTQEPARGSIARKGTVLLPMREFHGPLCESHRRVAKHALPQVRSSGTKHNANNAVLPSSLHSTCHGQVVLPTILATNKDNGGTSHVAPAARRLLGAVRHPSAWLVHVHHGGPAFVGHHGQCLPAQNAAQAGALCIIGHIHQCTSPIRAVDHQRAPAHSQRGPHGM